MTITDAIANAVRLLEFAEGEADLVKLEAFARLADGWIAIATLIHDQEMA